MGSGGAAIIRVPLRGSECAPGELEPRGDDWGGAHDFPQRKVRLGVSLIASGALA